MDLISPCVGGQFDKFFDNVESSRIKFGRKA